MHRSFKKTSQNDGMQDQSSASERSKCFLRNRVNLCLLDAHVYKVSSLETLLVRGVMMYSAYPWVMSVFGKSTDGVA